VGQSRAAVGVGTGLILLFTLTLSSNSRLKIGTLLLSIFIFILSTFFAGGVVDKQLKNQEAHDVLSGRSRIWNVTLEAAKLYPVFGIGIDNRAVVTREVIKNSIESRHGFFDDSNYDFSYKHSHSFYLTNIAERGVVGSVITLFFIFMWLRQLFKTYYLTKQSDQAAYLWAGSMGAWMTTFGIGFVNTTFHHEHGILSCLFLGLYLSYCKSHAKV
jgi:O-antigen ligase